MPGWQDGHVTFPPARLRAHSAPGFSLLEMLITLALILVLFTMLYGFGSRSHQRTQKQACGKNLQNIYLALDIHAKENNGALPVIPGATSSETPLSQLVPRYTVASEAFVCPGSKDTPVPNGEPFGGRRISYAYLMGQRLAMPGALLMSDRQVNALPKQTGEPVFSSDGKPPANNHHQYGGVFLFADGHTETSAPKAPFAITWPTNVTFLNPKP
jgi:prepilin-type N-terminal cleavage/methylation domain-containing protein